MKLRLLHTLLLITLCPCLVVANSDTTSKGTSSYTTLVFPDDLSSTADYARYENQLLQFNQTLYITNTYYWQRYGQVTLSSERLYSPTEIHIPASPEYYTELNYNNNNQITLDDGSNSTYPSPLPWANAYGTLRTGMQVDTLRARLVNTEYGWALIPEGEVNFTGNPRPTALPDISADKVRVAGFNLEHYIVNNFGSGFGPDNQTQSDRQHAKITKALININADIYALCEVQTGQNALLKLTNALNTAEGYEAFAYVNDGSTTSGSYSKVGYIYRKDKVSPIKNIKENDTQYTNRKKGQGFTFLSNQGGFILLMNHFKAKSGSGSGADADAGDGQGTYNGTRVKEAESTLRFATECQGYFGDLDILIMGDLNAHSMEDPVQTLINGAYTNLIYQFRPNELKYSYMYRSTAGCLDHAIANANMLTQVTDTYIYHINTDEPSFFEYSNDKWSNDMFRSSDHDPVIVELKINATDTSIQVPAAGVIYSHNNSDIFTIVNAKNHYMDIYTPNGNKVYCDKITQDSQTFSIDNTNMQTGIYIIKLTEIQYVQPKTTALKLIVH